MISSCAWSCGHKIDLWACASVNFPEATQRAVYEAEGSGCHLTHVRSVPFFPEVQLTSSQKVEASRSGLLGVSGSSRARGQIWCYFHELSWGKMLERKGDFQRAFVRKSSLCVRPWALKVKQRYRQEEAAVTSACTRKRTLKLKTKTKKIKLFELCYFHGAAKNTVWRTFLCPHAQFSLLVWHTHYRQLMRIDWLLIAKACFSYHFPHLPSSSPVVFSNHLLGPLTSHSLFLTVFRIKDYVKYSKVGCLFFFPYEYAGVIYVFRRKAM